jgi:hypothetical protein
LDIGVLLRASLRVGKRRYPGDVFVRRSRLAEGSTFE